MSGEHFQEYVESLLCLISCPYLNHANYARWLSSTHRIHNFAAMHPSLYKEFCEEYFVARKTHPHFLSLPLIRPMSSYDLVKNDGGVVALVEKATALKCCVINDQPLI